MILYSRCFRDQIPGRQGQHPIFNVLVKGLVNNLPLQKCKRQRFLSLEKSSDRRLQGHRPRSAPAAVASPSLRQQRRICNFLSDALRLNPVSGRRLWTQEGEITSDIKGFLKNRKIHDIHKPGKRKRVLCHFMTEIEHRFTV